MSGEPGRRRSPSPRKGARPCELCYRPLADDEERYCSSCLPKAEKLGRRLPPPVTES